jgi:nitrous oxidase accessory protein NosD
MARRHSVQAIVLSVGLLVSATAHARIVRVPQQHATIQAAVDAAKAGDTISVGPGEYCGAEITKRVNLVGHGHPVIIGCDTSPIVGGARAGFLLPGSAGVSAASGTRIAGFTFDGAGVSDTNLEPLAYGVLARFASDVGIVHNRFVGTVQAITNTAGDRWAIWQNEIVDLTAFGCPGLCSGGDGIVVQIARGSLQTPEGPGAAVNRPEQNFIAHNRISATIPDGFAAFSFVGILLLAADATTVVHNDVNIADNPRADAPGEGIVITNLCCGDTTPILPGSRNNFVAFNDGRGSQTAIVVEGSNGDNTQGLSLFKNHGSVVIEGTPQPGSKPPHHHGNNCLNDQAW